MRLVDVNVLVYAFRTDAPEHKAHRAWIEGLVGSDEAYAVSDHVLAGFLRVVTHPKVFYPPTPLEPALAFARAFRERANAVPLAPGERHWDIFATVRRGRCQGQPRAGHLACGPGHRVRLRIRDDRPRLRPLSGAALEAPPRSEAIARPPTRRAPAGVAPFRPRAPRRIFSGRFPPTIRPDPDP